MSLITLTSSVQKIILINVSVVSVLATSGIYYVSNESAVSQIETMQSSAFAVSRIGHRADQRAQTENDDDEHAGFMAFSKMFAKEDAISDNNDSSLLGPKGSYEEVYIGKRFE